MSRPFDTSLRRDPGESRDLIARVDAEVRDRIGEAVDFVCLETMVESRRAAGLPVPAPDNTRDRQEFDAHVEAFLAHLADTMLAALDAQQQRAITGAAEASRDRLTQLLGVQVALAKQLPDYWQRFEQIRGGWPALAVEPPSSRDRSGWLDRLFRR